MANLTLVYGMRLLPSEDVAEVGQAPVKLTNGREARVTMHVLEGSKEEIEKQLRTSLEAFFDLYPEILDLVLTAAVRRGRSSPYNPNASASQQLNEHMQWSYPELRRRLIEAELWPQGRMARWPAIWRAWRWDCSRLEKLLGLFAASWGQYLVGWVDFLLSSRQCCF